MNEPKQLKMLLRELRIAQLNVDYNNNNWVESWKKTEDENRKIEIEALVDKLLLTYSLT